MATIQIQLEDKTKDLKNLTDQLSDKNITVANVRAINTAIRKATTQYRRDISKNYNLTYAGTKDLVVPERATYTDPDGTISGNIKPVSLSRFNPTFIKSGKSISIKSVKDKKSGRRGLQQKVKNAKKTDSEGGVSFEIKRGDTKTLPFAFLVKSQKPGLSQQIWARGSYDGNKFVTGKKRMPIAALKTVGPFGMMTGEETQKEVGTLATDTMRKEFERQVNLLLQTKSK